MERKKILLIYGDPQHHQGLQYDSLLKQAGYTVHLDETRERYRTSDVLERLLDRAPAIGYGAPDIAVVGSHLDPEYITLFEKANIRVLMLTSRSERELQRDPGIDDWKKSPIFGGIANKGDWASVLHEIKRILTIPPLELKKHGITISPR